MNKQITNCKIDIKAYNGVSNFSFQGYPKNVALFSGMVEWKPYFYDGSASDQALSGRLRSHLAGYRMEGSLFWERQINATNFIDILDKSTVGVEKLFASNVVAGPYVSNTNVALTTSVGPDDALNGMRVDFDGSEPRTITDYYNSNKTMILNASISLSGTEVANIYATANMEPTVLFFADASDTTNEAIIFTDTAFSVQIQSTVTSQPTRIDFTGRDYSDTIPTAYKI